jgi:hypothetical protein
MAPISYEQALDIARRFIGDIDVEADDTMVVREDLTKELPFGWVFFYDAKRFVDTGDPKYVIRGNAPLIIDRADGSTRLTGTARPLNHYIQEFEKERKRSRRPR